jgi:hypothetical protein
MKPLDHPGASLILLIWINKTFPLDNCYLLPRYHYIFLTIMLNSNV